MGTDFERELSDLLHALTPEPPSELSAPRVATLPRPVTTDADATVLELTTGVRTAPVRRRRWSVALAAAAILALAAGVVTVARTDLFGSSHTARPGGPNGTQKPTRHLDGAPACVNDQLVITQGSRGLVAHGGTGAAVLIVRNNRATPCTMTPPAVTIGPDVTGGVAFPVVTDPVRIPGNGQLVLTANVQISGRCRSVPHGQRINLIQGHTTYSTWLDVSGCLLTPLKLGVRVTG